MKTQELKVPKNQHCPVCNSPVTNVSAVRSGPHPQFVKGTVIVCSSCSVVLRVGDSGLVQMTADAVNKLSAPSKQAIMMTKLAITRILQRNKRPVDIISK